ncbi:MAG: tRNA pseudouridine(38-40) synthase TruA [Bacillota bacterium]
MDLNFRKALENKDKESLDKLLHKDVVMRRADETTVYGISDVLNALMEERLPDIEQLKTYENLTLVQFKGTLALKLKYRSGLISRLYFDYLNKNSKRIRIDLSYDGTLYHGFQRQKKKETIQGTIEKVLNHLTGESVTITPSGRTDKGVHALKQVVHFDTKSPLEPERLKTLMNRMLPPDIVVMKLQEVPGLFHARFDVGRKVYHYTIIHERDAFKAHYAFFHDPIDLGAFNAILTRFEGVHDFSGFTRKNAHAMTWRSVRTCKAVKESGKTVVIVESEGFLRHMVRYMVGTALRDLDKGTKDVQKALKHPKDSHVYLAPAQGLALYDVHYTLN